MVNTPLGMVNGVKDVKMEIKKHFQSFFKEFSFERPLTEGLIFKRLNLMEKEGLESHFSEAGIKEAV